MIVWLVSAKWKAVYSHCLRGYTGVCVYSAQGCQEHCSQCLCDWSSRCQVTAALSKIRAWISHGLEAACQHIHQVVGGRGSQGRSEEVIYLDPAFWGYAHWIVANDDSSVLISFVPDDLACTVNAGGSPVQWRGYALASQPAQSVLMAACHLCHV